MKKKQEPADAGFALLELLIVIAIIAILASIAIPNYAVYIKKANSIKCLSIRRDIEIQELARLTSINAPVQPAVFPPRAEGTAITHVSFGKTLQNIISSILPWNISESWASLAEESLAPPIDSSHKCPSGGTFLWLVSDPQEDDFPKVACSIHFGAVPVAKEESPNFTVPSGENVSSNSSFESITKPPKPGRWKSVPSSQVDGWESTTGKIEFWGNGMQGVQAPDGGSFIELDSNNKKKTPDVLSQQMPTEAGRVYIVQLKARARKAGTSDFEILWDGESVSEISPKVGIWSDYTVKVTGTGAPATLSLAEIVGQNNGLGALIDSIQVIATNEVR
jgi:prepilin-type N-terminal cleavage/methylation domain-containing protein